MSAFWPVRLEPETPRCTEFDCGDDDLNEFFSKDSVIASRELIAVTYAWVADGKVMAYFSVSNDALKREEANRFNKVVRKIPNRKRFKSQPAVKIGRLAVHRDAQKSGIGSELLDFIKGWFVFGNKTGCRFIIVDALNKPSVIGFYRKNGFDFLRDEDESEKTRLMYFDLAKLVK